MKKNLVIVFGIIMLSAGFFLFCINIKTSAGAGPKPSATPSNSNRSNRLIYNGPISNKASNSFAGNASISNTGEFIPDPVATGETTVLDEAGVTLVYPKGYSMADVKVMYYQEADDPARYFTTRAELTSPDYGLKIMVLTSHNLTYEESMKHRMDVFSGDRNVRTLKSGEKSMVNGLELTTSSGTGQGFSWRIDAFRTPDGSLQIVSTGDAKGLKDNLADLVGMLQSVKLK